MLESRSPSGSGPVTRSLFSLKPAHPSRTPNGGPPPEAGPSGGGRAPAEDVSERLLSTLRGAAQALPPSVAPTSVRAIRSGQLVRALTDALAPERRRFEEELTRARQRALELEGELERIRGDRRAFDETRRVELPRLAALVDQERTRAEALEEQRGAFAARAAELEAELLRRDAAARALEAALPPEDGAEDDALARVHERLEAIAAGVAAAPPPPAEDDAPAAPAPDERLVEALLSSDARAVRLSALEQRVAELTGAAPDDLRDELPDDPPAGRAALALLRAAQEEARGRAERLEGQLGAVLEATRDLHGALVQERRRRSQVEDALRAALARLALLEQQGPAPRLPSLAGLVKGDVGPLLEALREEGRRRDEGLEGRLQRLSLATRAALERMAEILDRALVAGLFDRDLPRLDPEAFAAPIARALSDEAPAPWARPLDRLDDDDLLDDDEDAGTDDAGTDDEPPYDDPPGDDPPSDEPPHDGPPGAGGEEAWETGGDEEGDAAAPLLSRPTPRAGADDPAQHGFLDQLLEDDDDLPATPEELDGWFRPGRPGQTEAEREAEQLAAFDLEPPPAPPAPPELPRARAPTPGLDDRSGELEGLDADLAGALRGDLAAERQRLEERVREAERALESEVWRGLATHRELVTTRQRLEALEARLAAPAALEEPAALEPAPTLGGLEPIPGLQALAPAPTPAPTDAHAAVLSLEVEDRDSWVHWLLLENDPTFRLRRAREVERCAEAVRASGVDPDELLHWLEAE
ncbi:MAG: hypothetical protein M9894_24275 [Planctomycetes bacterium]|nr:hypothetical protein [Planctomycetota bacterium]